MAERGLYMYAISRGLTGDALRSASGINGATLGVVEHRGLVAVVSEVGLDDFGEEGLKRNLENLEWLEDVARAHDAVVQASFARGPTAPLRLATICLDEPGVRARLDEWFHALVQVLDRVEGRVEWSVKAFAMRQPAPDDQPSSGRSPEVTSGAAYLQRKKAQTVAKQSSSERALQIATDLHAALAHLSVASRRLPPQDARLTGHQGTMTLNGAYLVDQGEVAAFAEHVRGLAARHPEAHLQLDGPWPPYSFAMLEQR